MIVTEAPDWKANTFRHDLWLWTAQTGLRPLTHSGSEESPQWSPDGRWIAFLSDRALPGEAAGADGEPESEAAKASRLWLIPVAGGEALPLFSEKLDVHSFAWSADGAAIYYSVTRPLTHEHSRLRLRQAPMQLRLPSPRPTARMARKQTARPRSLWARQSSRKAI